MEAAKQKIDDLDVGGIFTVEVTRDGKHGPEVIARRVFRNTVVNSGKKQLLRRACGLQTNDFDAMRIGTSGATVVSNQTNVLSPVTGTLHTVGTKSVASGRTLQLVLSYASSAGSKSASGISEIAILNQPQTSPGGSCFARGLISPAVNKTTSDLLTITYEVRVT